MPVEISAPEPFLDLLRKTAEEEGLPFIPVPEREAAPLRVVPSGRRRAESNPPVLHPGGFVSCSRALKAASDLGVPPAAFGRLLDILDIKVRSCSLGLFK